MCQLPKLSAEYLGPLRRTTTSAPGRGHGIAPDIVYARGVPRLRPPPAGTYNPLQCALLIIEVGYCQDFRLLDKARLKLCRYEPLVSALRETWGSVELIGLPVGNGGTVSGKNSHGTVPSTIPQTTKPHHDQPTHRKGHPDTTQRGAQGGGRQGEAAALRATRITLCRQLRDLSQGHDLLMVRQIRIQELGVQGPSPPAPCSDRLLHSN